MTKNIQVHVPTPCHEDWAAMQPRERGRFCASCCKTVVDFSLMSDREVLAYLADSSDRVCGRFAEDQLQRDLIALPLKKGKGWIIWNILMAGLLLASKTRGQGKAPQAVSQQADPGKAGHGAKRVHPVVMGAPLPIMGKIMAPQQPVKQKTIKIKNVVASSPVSLGEVKLEPENDTVAPIHIAELPPVEVIGYGRTGLQGGVLGGLSLGIYVSSPDTTFMQKLITDTIGFLGFGKKDLTLYPNPATRGTTIKLSLNLKEKGSCTIGLFNEAGMLMQARAIKLTGDPRVELFNLPVSLPGGLYFIKVSAPAFKKIVTEKLIVL